MMNYTPCPLDTSRILIPADILELIECLARNTHEIWARQRMSEGWKYGPRRDDRKKEHPDLIPYEELPESEKEYDRNTASETIRAILLLGYRIVK